MINIYFLISKELIHVCLKGIEYPIFKNSQKIQIFCPNKDDILDPPASTPAQRANFTATELFNNQDLYSSRRYAPGRVKMKTNCVFAYVFKNEQY